MKRLLFLLLLALPALCDAQQLGTAYLWNHATSATTSGYDSTFATKWEQVTIFADGAASFRAMSPDTTGFSAKSFTPLQAYQTISFGPSTPLKRLQIKGVGATVNVYLMGYKRVRQ